VNFYIKALAVLMLLSTSLFSSQILAELEELDNSTLEELKGQAGITIDIAFKWSIGEMAFIDGDGLTLEELRSKGIPEPPQRIDYQFPGKK